MSPSKSSLTDSSLSKAEKELVLRGDKEFSICAVTKVRNMARFIPPWIEHNLILGIKHFAILDDCSSDDNQTMEVLRHYERIGAVSYYTKPFEASKMPCDSYLPDESKTTMRLVEDIKSRCSWILVADIDEYLVKMDGSHDDSLVDLVLSHRDKDTIRFVWVMMSNHGIEKRQKSQIMLETYTLGQILPKWEAGVKTMARSDAILTWRNSHFPDLINDQEDSWSLNTNYKYLQSREHGRIGLCIMPHNKWVLKHFRYLSYEEFEETRLSRNFTASGRVNFWRNNSREAWGKKTWTKKEGCIKEFGRNFTAKSIPRIWNSLNKQYQIGTPRFKEVLDSI